MRCRHEVTHSARRVLLPLAAGLLGAAILGGLYLSIVSLVENIEAAGLRLESVDNLGAGGIFRLITARAGRQT